MRLSQGNSPSITLAGVTLPLSATILTANTNTGNYYDTFRRSGTAYQVPVGKVLIIRAIRIHNNTASSSAGADIGYADAAATNQVGAPTATVILGTGGAYNSPTYTKTTTAEFVDEPCYYSIAAGKYPLMRGIAAGVLVTLLCEEVAV